MQPAHRSKWQPDTTPRIHPDHARSSEATMQLIHDEIVSRPKVLPKHLLLYIQPVLIGERFFAKSTRQVNPYVNSLIWPEHVPLLPRETSAAPYFSLFSEALQVTIVSANNGQNKLNSVLQRYSTSKCRTTTVPVNTHQY